MAQIVPGNERAGRLRFVQEPAFKEFDDKVEQICHFNALELCSP